MSAAISSLMYRFLNFGNTNANQHWLESNKIETRKFGEQKYIQQG